MIDSRPVSARRYYDVLPNPVHRCGDIWTNLPTFGLLGADTAAGILVTPACDLSNTKSETLTYLPIIPLRSYFSTRAMVPTLKKRAMGALQSGKFEPTIEWSEHEFRTPSATTISGAVEEIESHLAAKTRGKTEIAALNRAIAALKVLCTISEGILQDVPYSALSDIFGSDLNKMLERMISNSHSTDLHFLPSDDQNPMYSGLPQHSLVLFRYPLTIPIEVLDLARDSNPDIWPEERSLNESAVPSLKHYSSKLPLKALSLQSAFLSDLLSRYVNVFNRLGSPDFTSASISRILSEVIA